MKEEIHEHMVKMEQEQDDVDWGEDDVKTGNASLDEVLGKLREPDSQMPPSLWQPVVGRVASSTDGKVAESAATAFAELARFTQEEVEPIINRCIEWLYKNMNEFDTIRGIRMFGSHYYGLPLASSDADIVVVLSPGENSKGFLRHLYKLSTTSPAFTESHEDNLRDDTYQTEFEGLPVDIKAIKAADRAVKSTNAMKNIIKQRYTASDPKFQAMLIFKLICHYNKIT